MSTAERNRDSNNETESTEHLLLSNLKQNFAIQQTEFQNIKKDVERRANELTQKLAAKEAEARQLIFSLQNKEMELDSVVAAHTHRETQIANELASVKEALKRSQEREVALAAEIQESQAQLEVAALKEALKHSQEREAQLAKDIHDSQAQFEINSLKEALRKSQEREAHLSTDVPMQIATLKSALQQSQEREAQVTKEIQEIQAQFDLAVDIGNERANEIKRLRASEAELKRARGSFQTEIRQSEQFLEDLEQTVFDLQAQLTQKNQELKAAEAHIQSLTLKHVSDHSQVQAQVKFEAESRERKIQAELDRVVMKLHARDQEVAALRAELNEQESEGQELRKRQDADLQTIRGKESELRQAAERLREERDLANSNLNQVTATNAFLTEQVSVLQAQTHEVMQSFKKARADFTTEIEEGKRRESALANTIELLTSQVREREVAATKNLATVGEIQSKLQAADDKIFAAQVEITELKKQNAHLTQALNTRQNEIQSLNNRITDARAESDAAVGRREALIESLTKSSNDAKAEAAALQARIEELSQKIATQTEKSWQITSELSHTKDKLSTALNAIALRDNAIAELTETVDGLKFRNAEIATHLTTSEQNFKSASDASETRVRMLEAQIAALRAEIVGFEKQTVHAVEEANLALEQLAELKDANASEKAALELQAEKVAKREAQTTQYADALAKEKAQLTQVANALMREIQAAQGMNPLKDFLALTEFELSKLEVQLKTTPTVAPERAKFEIALKQLVEQRDFLRATLAHSQRQLAQQTQALQNLTKGTASVAVPPPVPKNRQFSIKD